MLLQPLSQPLPFHLQVRGWQSLESLTGLQADEQLELACRTVVGVLVAARPLFIRTREDREAYDVLCDEVEEWFQAEIVPLRFGRTQ